MNDSILDPPWILLLWNLMNQVSAVLISLSVTLQAPTGMAH